MKKTLLLTLLASCALLSACAAHVTIRNDRKTAVKNVEVKAGAVRYVVPQIEAGASDTHEIKVAEETSVGVNFTSEEGGLYYTASKTKLKKGDSRKLLLKITEQGNLETEDPK